MRRRIWIPALALVSVVLVGVLLASPWAKRQAHREAASRGLVLEMDDFSLGWFQASLTGVSLSLDGVQQIHITVDQVVVDLSLSSPKVQRIEAQGGHVSIDGELDEVKEALQQWRARRPPSSPQSGSNGQRRTELIRNFNITWKNAFGVDKTQGVTGLQVERGPQGQRLGADLIELQMDALQAQIAGAELTFQDGFTVKTAHAAEMRVSYVAPPVSVAPEPPSTDPSSNGSEEPKNSPGLDQRLERNAARVALLRKALRLIRTKAIPRIPPKSSVDKMWVTYKRGSEKLHVGPSHLNLAKKNSEFHLGIAPQGTAKGTPLTFHLTVHPQSNENAATVELEGGPVSLSTLGVEEGAFGLNGVEHTTLSGDLKAQLSQDASTVTGGGEALIEGLAIYSPRLATTLVSFPKLALSGGGQVQVDGSRYQLTDGSVRLGEATFKAAFDIERGTDFVILKANAEAPLVSCQALLDSAPRGLLGAAESMRFDGTFSLHAGVEADTRKLSQMKVRWDFKNGCRIKAVPSELNPERFRSLFRREVLGAGNVPIQIEFGPHSTSWIPYDEISPYMEKALLVTEDGRFFRHDGFDDRAVESAIRDNVRQGKFVRGASTISMQLAKNLYLSRKKTLSRKFQEAALTSLLEQSFEKRELLELYLNVIEFGPGIYGIRQAAEHYFSSHPGRLTASQAFFLASILPAPTREYFEADGNLKEQRRIYIHHLLKISHKREALTDDELNEALDEELIFGRPETRQETDAETDSDVDAPPGGDSKDSALSNGDQAKGDHEALDNEPVFPLKTPTKRKTK